MSKYEKYKNQGISWEDAIAKYAEYSTIPYRPEGSKLPPTHIEDMDQSVRWNMQFVEDHNKKWDRAKKNLDNKRREIINQAQDMVKYLMCEELEWKLTDDDIHRLFSRWYDRHHSYGFDYLCNQIQCELSELTEMDWFKELKGKV